MKHFYTFLITVLVSGLGFGQVIYDADFSTSGGFDHNNGNPPAAGPQTFDGGNYTIGYDTAPGTDSSGNYFRSDGTLLESADFGGAAYFETDPIDISGQSTFSIDAIASTVGSAVFNGSGEQFTWSYIIDSGTPVSGPNITSDGSLNSPPSWTNIAVTGNSLVVRFDFNINGGGDGFEVSQVEVIGNGSSGIDNPDAFSSTPISSSQIDITYDDNTAENAIIIVFNTDNNFDTPTGFPVIGNSFGNDEILFYVSGMATLNHTGLLESTTYYYKAYSYLFDGNHNYSSGITSNSTTDCLTPTDVSNFTTIANDTAVDLNWTNGSCFDEILIVAKADSAVSVTPTGDGTAYTADAGFGSGTELGTGEYVVYKGTDTSLTVTGLTNGTTYHFTAFTRKGMIWSGGETDSATPILVEEAVAGDLIITEVSGDASAAGNDNGYMEIYNRSNKIINLNNIEARYFNSNPGNSTQQVSLSGTLSPGSFIIVTQNSGNYTLEYSDTADAIGSSFFFNGGDDGCDVFHTSNGVIDQFNDNGNGQSPWTWSDNFTYYRNSSDSGAIEVNWTQNATDNPRTKPNLYFWTGNIDGSWINTGNWDEGLVPSSTTDVIITDQINTPSISTSVDVFNLTTEINSELTVEKNGNLEILDNLNSNGDLTLESDSNEYSSLIVNGSSIGDVKYERFINSNSGRNDLIAPPLTGETWSDFLSSATNATDLYDDGSMAPSTITYLFGTFDKAAMPAASYVEYDSGTTTTLTSGVGYRAATKTGATLTFTGTVNTGTVPITIENSGIGFEEWNLIGNPYPSYISAYEFLNHNINNNPVLDNMSGAIYGYKGQALDRWEIINLSSVTSPLPDVLIAPGQGFFVASGVPVDDAEFTTEGSPTAPEMRRSNGGDDFIANRSSQTSSNYNLEITASTTNTTFKTDFYFNGMSSLGLDPGYDSKLFGEAAPSFSIYSHLVEDNIGLPMGIQSLGENDLATVSIPLGVNANQGEQLTFSISESTLPSTIDVYLDDTVANTSTLLTSGNYILTPNITLNGTGRFYLRTGDSALSSTENTLNSLTIYTNETEKTVVITGQLVEDTKVNIYDLQGRNVISKDLNSSSTSNTIDVSNLSIGVYVVQLQNGTQSKTQKVILK